MAKYNKNPRDSAGGSKYENAKDYGKGEISVMIFGFNAEDMSTWVEYSTKRPILGVSPSFYSLKGMYSGKTLKIALFVSNKVDLSAVNKHYFEWAALAGERAYLEKHTIND